MILADLPPVGGRVETRGGLPLADFPGYRPLWLHSGTAALALALLHARQQRPDIAAPEILIPAYGCPDLVAATVYAGARPVLVDIGANDPGFDLRALQRTLNKHTLAVIAVNFLGIRERLDDIRALLPSDVVLVEDSAQWYPELDGANLTADYVITSFGRGKPSSVLGGGLLLLREDRAVDTRELAWQIRVAVPESVVDRLRYRAKIALYNLLRRPGFYFWLNRNPLLRLGETRYKPLGEIRAMSPFGQAILAVNIGRHLSESRWREAQLDRFIADLSGVEPLGAAPRRGRLLRYPVLCASRGQRDRLLNALQRSGLGASSMYQRPLLAIPGVEALAIARETPRGAGEFAGRLLTLPVHSGVTRNHLRGIEALCRRLLGSS